MLVLLAAAVSLVVALASGGHPRKDRASRVGGNTGGSVVGAQPSGKGANNSAITGAEAARILTRYSRAYNTKSPAELSRLFAPGFTRDPGDAHVESTSSALTAFQYQFAKYVALRYDLSDVRVASRPDARAVAHASYRLSSNGTVISTGSTAFGLVKLGNRVAIQSIRVVPNSTSGSALRAKDLATIRREVVLAGHATPEQWCHLLSPAERSYASGGGGYAACVAGERKAHDPTTDYVVDAIKGSAHRALAYSHYAPITQGGHVYTRSRMVFVRLSGVWYLDSFKGS